MSILKPFLERNGVLILDGGLATELERKGADLNHHLWSAKLLAEKPDLIRQVYRDYLHAGADCIATASYQASEEGLTAAGFSVFQARELMRFSVSLAIEERNIFSREHPDRIRPLVSASIGPYGAYLADGSEYTGKYEVEDSVMRDFHASRLRLLADSEVDIIAFETIPSIREARIVLDVLGESTDKPAWISFQCRDETHVAGGTPIKECTELVNTYSQIEAIGINCVPPALVSPLINEITTAGTEKYIAVYPNSGEVYHADTKTWHGTGDPASCGIMAGEWFQKGARLIGGCCRTGPEHIASIRSTVG